MASGKGEFPGVKWPLSSQASHSSVSRISRKATRMRRHARRSNAARELGARERADGGTLHGADFDRPTDAGAAPSPASDPPFRLAAWRDVSAQDRGLGV